MDQTAFIQLLKNNNERMELFFGSDVQSNARIPLAVQFTFSRETFNGPLFEKNVKGIHSQKSKQSFFEFFSTPSNKSVLTYKMLGHFVLHPQPEQELHRVRSNEKALLSAGFKSSGYLHIASLFLTDEAHAKRAKILHNEMKKHHYFLTGKDDIPYAVLLTKKQSNPVNLAETMRKYYDALHSEGFKNGDALQAMTQLLSLYDEEFQPVLTEYVVAMRQSFINSGVKVKKRFYPYIALLAVAGATSEVVDEIVEMERMLAKLSMFMGMQPYALMVAVQFVLKNLIENDTLSNFNDSLLFMQALTMSDYIGDLPFLLAIDILDIIF
ncbi:DUF4003 family protein [Solibacillus sp. FSL R5-0449]|uniref:DUF4003 family protein n=1 Tax=Solibacillus sp. FSL R5-0449 TaxID=2921639 RepID=UPI0030D598CB